MPLKCQSIELLGEAGEAKLVFANAQLVAVVLELSDGYEGLSGAWNVEAAFGPLSGLSFPMFTAADEALEWLNNKLQTIDNGN